MVTDLILLIYRELRDLVFGEICPILGIFGNFWEKKRDKNVRVFR